MEPKRDDVDALVSLMTNAAEVDDSDDAFAHRRARFKAKPMDHQQKRREEALQQQKDKRLDRTILARKLASVQEPKPIDLTHQAPISDTQDVQMVPKGGSSARGSRDTNFETQQRKLYMDQLQLPEPLIEIPTDFIDNWMCVPIPAGSSRVL
jgi:hypothetical protein